MFFVPMHFLISIDLFRKVYKVKTIYRELTRIRLRIQCDSRFSQSCSRMTNNRAPIKKETGSENVKCNHVPPVLFPYQTKK